jgi:type IV pilus assembly protein PilE
MTVHMKNRCGLRGFTLIEMLVVLVILAILAAIAYPSYLESVRKAKRVEGRAALAKIMQQQERYYSLHTTYIEFSSTSSGENEKKFQWFSGERAASSFYEIDARACDGEHIRDCVLLTAHPGTINVDQHYRDPICGNLTLNSRGERKADADKCWQ